MKRILTTSIILCFVLSVFGQFQRENLGNSSGNFTNPLFAGDYPDPSILRDGDDYYIVHSSFEYYPGLLIWHSSDLINWNPVTNALFKNVGSVFAPDLVKFNGRYYIYFPAGPTNWVVWADDIAGPWSDPIDLKISGIDPGHVVDKTGKRFLYFSDGGYAPLSDDGLQITGSVIHAYDGWPIPRDWAIECFCLEGPKLVQKGDYYYLTVAEGGTAGPATSHMIISARSKSPFGPWENSPFNPIDRTLSASEKWWSKGHATLFEDANGKWWIVFHGYEKEFQNMGRQTLLQPIEWTNDGWFKIPDGVSTDQPFTISIGKTGNSNYCQSDDFTGKTLKSHWKFFGEYDPNRITPTQDGLIFRGKGESVGNSSPMLCIPSDHSYTADLELQIEKGAIGGLVLFYNSFAYNGLLATENDILVNLKGWQYVAEKKSHNGHVYLRLRSVNNLVDMFYSLDGKSWIKLESSFYSAALQHNALGGFMSLRIGITSTGNGNIILKNFKYKPID